MLLTVLCDNITKIMVYYLDIETAFVAWYEGIIYEEIKNLDFNLLTNTAF